MSLVYHQNMTDELYVEYRDVFERIKPKSTILELGCHTGYFGSYLMRHGHVVDGVEYNAEAAAIAQTQGINVLVADLDVEDLSVLTGKFNKQYDYILMMNILEHLKYPKNLLESVYPLLKPSGRILVSGPNIACWSVRRDLLLGKWEYTETGIMDKTHLRFFTFDSWKKLIVEAGYEITHTSSSSYTALPAARFLTPLLGKKVYFKLHQWFCKKFPGLFTVVFTFEAKRNEP